MAAEAAGLIEKAKDAAPREALSMAIKAKDIYQELGEQSGMASAYAVMATAQAKDGSLDDALQSADEALDIYLELKDKAGEADTMLSMAKMKLDAGKAGKAISDAEDALEVYQSINSPKEGQAMKALFSCCVTRGNLYKAKKVALDGMARFSSLGNKEGEGDAMFMLVNMYIQAGKYDQAIAMADKALLIFEDLKNYDSSAKLLCLTSQIYLTQENYEKAVQLGLEAITLLKETGGSADKITTMETVISAYLAQGDDSSALDTANDMRSHFNKEGDVKGEAAAWMKVCAVHFKMENLDQAASACSKAQGLFAETGDSKAEGAALRMMAEVSWKKKEWKTTVKTAEKARALFREQGEVGAEACCLYMIAHSSVQVAVGDEGAKVGESKSFTKAATDAINKAQKTCDNAMKLARDADWSGDSVLASSLCVMAQVHMLNGKFEEALGCADEGVVIFREGGDFKSEGQALLLSADALLFTRDYGGASEAAGEALNVFTHFSPDESLQDLANQILGHVNEIQEQIRQQQQMQQMQYQQQFQMNQPGQFQMQPQQWQQEEPQQAQSVAREAGPRGPALDLSAGLDTAVIRNKVLEIAVRITGAEDGEIEVDTPLMEAGLTSNSAILLRDELSQELPGVNLPVTLVFDYPSIGAMCDLIVESAGKKKLK
jgi:tetratricopeptide (TPR) repeat protein